MRRILLATFALLLLHAAPAMATECTNLALASNGGVASVSSVYSSSYSATPINNGRREDGPVLPYWMGEHLRYPAWAQVEWSAAQTLDRIAVRGVIEWWSGGSYADRAPRRHRSVRVQYWDAATAVWVDVAGRTGQDNPILDWVNPWLVGDGSEYRQFDVTPITTTKIRVLFESGPATSPSLDEIEAYGSGSDCDPPPSICTNRAIDGTVTASSTHSSGDYPLSGVTNGERESGATRGYWNDNTNGTWPDWVQAEWARAIEIDRIVARIPLAQRGFPLGEITLRRTRIQYWDTSTSAWVDVVGRTGQDNPIIDWTGPIDRADGTETKTFDITPVTTTKVRVLIEDGSTDGWSWLDELEVYSTNCTTTPRDTNLALAGTPSANDPNDLAAINDGRLQTNATAGVWQDFTGYGGDDWAAINWSSPQSINRIVVRGPWLDFPPDWNRRLEKTRIQYWDAAIPKWRDVASSQPNPVIDWLLPYLATDGSEIRQFDFPTISTRRIRVFFEESTYYRYGYLEELEAYWIS